MPLHLRCSHARSWPLIAGMLALYTSLTGVTTAAPAYPQDRNEPAVQTVSGTTPPVSFRERPRYPTEPQRLRRTVQIDGVLSDGEWDAFYTVTDGPIQGVFYCQWDDSYLYLAARTERPAMVIFSVDGGGDGWLRSADNIEIVTGSVTEGSPLALTARLLDAANAKETPAWNENAIPVASILASGRVTGGTQVIELAIPRNTAGLMPRAGAAMGLRADFLPPGQPADFKPVQPFEPRLLLDAVLVEARTQSVPGLSARLTLSDEKCVAGQELGATLELRNQTDLPIAIKTVTWSGQGHAASALNLLRVVAVPTVEPRKARKLSYKTVLPADLPVGAYTLQVVAELPDGRQVQSSTSFQVVEPLQVQIAADPNPVTVVGTTPLSVYVDVYSAVMGGIRGEVELTDFPGGWELEKNIRRKPCVTTAQDRKTSTRFKVTLPSSTPAGEYPIGATVTYRGRAWRVKTVVRVERTDAPAASPKTDR
ncbi:MAG: hypothetical protein NZ557_05280 [Chthonomonadaceae bacterium]|nr:hypothetical protein [Chthonomonadaceae bacterium]